MISKKDQTKLRIFSSKGKFARYFSNYMFIIAIIVPLMTIPQAIKIWAFKSAEDVSLITWIAFLISAISWLIHSIIHKDRVLMINSILWVVLESIVIIGVVIYS